MNDIKKQYIHVCTVKYFNTERKNKAQVVGEM